MTDAEAQRGAGADAGPEDASAARPGEAQAGEAQAGAAADEAQTDEARAGEAQAGESAAGVARPQAADDTPRTTDRVRQVAVAASAVLAVAGSALGSGAFGGTQIQDAAGGALAADATVLAPGSGAFAIWTAVYLGLVAVAVVQLLPGRGTDEAHRATGWLLAASMLLNAAWILLAQAGQLVLTVAVIVVLVVVLGALAHLLVTRPARRRLDVVVLEATTGLYLGWASVATAADVAATLTDAGLTAEGAAEHVWGVAVVAQVAAVAVAACLATASRRLLAAAIGIAAAWGLGWIALGRLAAGPESPPVAIAATVAALVVLVVAVTAVVRRR
ncbi:putative integral membrane protein [Beutenbergia cavernae DSM 12333]|uniref:Putative integral membrane protein n=1 Tax=Beutenbergia cavernae (strain ATCC BAA-8 / DSM 12333 / CCUG 43141 / JCM 11478 / NBRC 16432 / NCIMB 13614 / HKI 0122) TaxID=471853 RepID=C5C1C8_BEUC1|nr:tryptophan-rich sensory protein [Beutenbergia cavernae]ACQ81538.1 putative integral membrane protein [Beutenbergia cavernae DSM 12333]